MKLCSPLCHCWPQGVVVSSVRFNKIHDTDSKMNVTMWHVLKLWTGTWWHKYPFLMFNKYRILPFSMLSLSLSLSLDQFLTRNVRWIRYCWVCHGEYHRAQTPSFEISIERLMTPVEMCESVSVWWEWTESGKVKICPTDNHSTREGIVPRQVETTCRVEPPVKKNPSVVEKIMLPYPARGFPLPLTSHGVPL
jgi:hypothetical protein